MSTFEELIERAKAQTAALRATLAELAHAKPEVPSSNIPEIAYALERLMAYRNALLMTEPLAEDNGFTDAKVEAFESAIALLGGKLPKTKKKRSAWPHSVPRWETPETLAANGITPPKTTPASEIAHDMPVGGLSKGQRTILIACACRPSTNAMLIASTPYARESVRIVLSELRKLGYVETGEDGKHRATDAGIQALGDFEKPKKGAIIEALPKGERVIFDAIAAEHPQGISRVKLGLVTKYKKESVRLNVSALMRRELVTQDAQGLQILTDAAILELPSKPKPLRGRALREKILGELPEGERAILKLLFQEYPSTISKDNLMEWTDYARESVRISTSKLIKRGAIVAKDGGFQASPTLFVGGEP